MNFGIIRKAKKINIEKATAKSESLDVNAIENGVTKEGKTSNEQESIQPQSN